MDIGKKIRILRGNMKQADLARATGIDKAIISKIENGKMTGTVECHSKIAQLFGMKLSEFYAYMENEKNQPAQLRLGSTKSDVYKDFLEILTTIPLSKKMLPVAITIKKGEEQFLEETVKKVERFIIIIEGEAEIEIEGQNYKLKKEPGNEKGDSLYSESSSRHKIKNTGETTAKLICVSAPPVL